MKRLALLLVLLALVSLLPLALAQESTATPRQPDPTSTAPDLVALATQIAEASAKADESLAQADRAFGLFEAFGTATGIFGLMTAVLTIVIPLGAVVAGIVGLNRLGSAEKELAAARTKFEEEIKAKAEELRQVQAAVEASTAEQKQNAANANLALSLLTLGERQYRSQDYQGAIDTYRRALELDPKSLITHYRLGYVYTQSGRLAEAEHHLNQALAIEAHFAPALAALGYVYRRIGEKMNSGLERDKTINRGEQLILQALSISNKLVDEDNESWWGSLGGLYRRRGQIDQAIEAYAEAAKVTPKSSYAYGNLALLYVQKGNREKMIPTYHRVEQLAHAETLAEVDNYWAYADLLTARLALGRAADAELTLQAVIELAPQDSPYIFESLIDTLTRLQSVMGETSGTHMTSFIERIRAQHEKRLAEKAERDAQAAAEAAAKAAAEAEAAAS